MNKFALWPKAVAFFALSSVIASTGMNLTTVNAAKTGAYYQSGGTATESGKTYAATNADQSAVYVTNAGTYTLSEATLTKTGNSSATEKSDFEGLNAGVLAEAGSTVSLNNSTITTNANGANGAFAYGTSSTTNGTTLNLNNVKIKTSADSSRGIDATYMGTINATNCMITTAGAHCAAIASDRGDGVLNVKGGVFTTAGEGSPPIYCTGAFTISGAVLKATGSEAAVIEGANSITLSDCRLSGAKKWGVMIYQSMSGDATGNKGTFTMTNGSLTATTGPLFYVTNTTGTIKLTNVILNYTNGTLIKAAAGNWGTSGTNGGTVNFTADRQRLAGDLVCDSISSISATLKNQSSLKGAINAAALTLDAISTWNVTGTSYLTSFTDANKTFANITDNGYTIYYDSSLSANKWLGGKTYTLKNKGKLTPGKRPVTTTSPTTTTTPSQTQTPPSGPPPSGTPGPIPTASTSN